MSKKINLGGERARVLKERSRERASEDRQSFLDNWPNELAGKAFHIRPTPAKEVAEIVRMDSGYTFTQYKSLAKLSVPFDCRSGMKHSSIMRTLPDIFEVTEIIYPGVSVEDQDDNL